MSREKYVLLSTGNLLVETGVLSIENKLFELLDSTEHELYIVTYTVSSKPKLFWQKLNSLLDREVKIYFIMEGSLEHDRLALELLERLKNYWNFNFYIFKEETPLHAKLIVSDGTRAILGSANITGGGLIQNHEIAIYIEGEKAWTLKKMAYRIVEFLEKDG